eukprot:3477576-Pyramimonas_sp.AAC.1
MAASSSGRALGPRKGQSSKSTAFIFASASPSVTWTPRPRRASGRIRGSRPGPRRFSARQSSSSACC